MKVNITIETIEHFKQLLDEYHTETESFLKKLSVGEKYEILTLTMMVRSNFNDFEEAYEAAKNKIHEQGLTEYFMERTKCNWQTLHGELQDVIAIQQLHGWEFFELMHSDDSDEDEEE